MKSRLSSCFLGNVFDGFWQHGASCLFCKPCGTRCLFGRNVFEERCFTHTGYLGDLFRGRSGRAVCGKRRCRSTDQTSLPYLRFATVDAVGGA